MNRTLSLAAATAAAFTATAQAQDRQPDAQCTRDIEDVASRLPDLSDNPDAAAEMGLDPEQLQAVLATLDAARIVNYDRASCEAMVEAARTVLERSSSN